MIKTLQGIQYLSGTSEGSLYPIALWHENGVKIGVRMELAKTPTKGIYGMALYARIQTFTGEGVEDQPLDYPAVAACLKDISMRISSPVHMSGFLLQCRFDFREVEGGVVALAEKAGECLAEIVSKIAEQHKMSCLSKAELQAIGAERFLAKTGDGAVEEAAVEQQLNPGFDFTKLLGGSDHPKEG